MLRLFRGTCLAVRAMHEYRPTSARSAVRQDGQSRASGSDRRAQQQAAHDDDADERFPQPEGDAEGGYSYDGASVPLVTKHRTEEEHDVVFDENEDGEQQHDGPALEIVPYAHRDLKPGCAIIIWRPMSIN